MPADLGNANTLRFLRESGRNAKQISAGKFRPKGKNLTQTQTLTHHQRGHIVHCLRVAADQFDHDAATFKEHLPEAEASCLAREFERYAAEARELADLIEDADSIATQKEAR